MNILQLTTLDKALRLEEKEIKKLHKEYLNPNLVSLLGLIKFDKVYKEAQGAVVKDEEGHEYLDFLGGYGALNIGHNHPEVLAGLEKVKEMPNILQIALGRMSAVLAKNLAQITPGQLQKTFFGNSGAEAVEGALKAAKAATKKQKIIYCEGSFHGKTMGALTVTGREKYKKDFLPLVPNCESVPYGDLESLEQKLKSQDVAAFIVEPIQGEGGIIVPPQGYLKQAEKLCHQYDALLIVDEIQTGFGRTGKMFACQYEDVNPDIMCLAKSLGGGVAPIGAYITTDKVYQAAYGSMEKATLHTSTFGGNTFATAAGILSLEIIVRDNLAQEALEKGNYLLAKLRDMQSKYSMLKDVRGKGLMIGLELEGSSSNLLNKLTGGTLENLSKEYFGSLVAGKLLKDYNIITAYTLNNPNVIRIEPPLNITYEQIDKLIFALEKIFSENKSFIKMALSNAKNIF